MAATMPCILAVLRNMVESGADSKAAEGERRVDQIAIQGAEEAEHPPGLSIQGEPGQWMHPLQSADHVSGRRKVWVRMPAGAEQAGWGRSLTIPDGLTTLGSRAVRGEGPVDQLAAQDAAEVESPPSLSGQDESEKWMQPLQPADHVTGTRGRRKSGRWSGGYLSRRTVRVKAGRTGSPSWG